MIILTIFVMLAFGFLALVVFLLGFRLGQQRQCRDGLVRSGRDGRQQHPQVFGQPLDLHQRRRIDALGNLAAEQQVQAAGHDDRVEGGVGNEVVDPVPDDGPGALAVQCY